MLFILEFKFNSLKIHCYVLGKRKAEGASVIFLRAGNGSGRGRGKKM